MQTFLTILMLSFIINAYSQKRPNETTDQWLARIHKENSTPPHEHKKGDTYVDKEGHIITLHKKMSLKDGTIVWKIRIDPKKYDSHYLYYLEKQIDYLYEQSLLNKPED